MSLAKTLRHPVDPEKRIRRLDSDILREEKSRPCRRGKGKPEKILLRPRPWLNRPSGWNGSHPQGCRENPLTRETKNGIVNRPTSARKTNLSMNTWEYITRLVPRGARRAVNRWKGPEPNREIRGDRRRKSSKEVVPPYNS
jgi:hypothetical protein